MNVDIKIRRAERPDSPRLMELVRGLALHVKAPEQVTVSPEHFEESGFGERPVWWAFVAETEGVIVGFALWYVRFSTWKGQRLYLEDLYVEPEMRGRGIGTMLFKRLVAEAKTQQFSGMMWQALEWNEPALRFYRNYNAGFENGMLNCSIDF